ncbi:MAG: type III-B CRISPR-associated protein Cas10/Cmr2 [Desulfurococcaceae archaeon]
MGPGCAQGCAPDSLLCLKTVALLHDPPNKMWVMRDGGNHEAEARKFAGEILKETTLEKCLEYELWPKVVEADGLAASFDRWFLLTAGDTKGFLWYEHLHNIFDPTRSHPLRLPQGVDVTYKVGDAATIANRYLKTAERELSELPKDKLAVTLYNVLYLVLEPVWYSLSLPPSLADTRVPTHTVFDHNYAAASMSNVLSDGGISGYYAVLDFPGVQKFIAGRKAGDLWVSSWVLSNVVWATGYRVAEDWGLDTILTPTPRLNPYAFKGLVSTVTKRPIYLVGRPGGFAEELCSMASRVYGLPVEDLWSQPLVPATMSLVLPRTFSSDAREASDKLLETFKGVWRELYDSVVSRLCGGRDHLSTFLCSKVRSLEEVLSLPPQGLSVAVIDLEKVYGDLEKCVVGGSSSECERLGLSVDRKGLERTTKGLTSGESAKEERVLRGIATKLLYHLVVTRGIELARRYGVIVRAVPRTFWYYSDPSKRFESVGGISADHVCSICGDEPSAMELSKVFRPGRMGFEDDYSNEVWSNIEKTVGKALSESERAEFRKFLKPGEVLGPYCLFKRATYLALRDTVVFSSTDDAALAWAAHILGSNRKGVLARIIQSLDKMGVPLGKCPASDVVRYLYASGEREVRDIGEKALECGLTYDEFVSRIEYSVREACRTAVLSGTVRSEELVEYVIELLGADGAIRELIESGGTTTVVKLCDILVPQTSYAILRSDADDVGKLMSGWSPIGLDNYVSTLVNHLREHGKIVGSVEVLENAERSYRASVELSKAVGLGDRVIVSPAWHNAVSLSLMLTAVEDYRTINRWRGMLVYSGGDDVLALLPVHPAVAVARDIRKNFTGDYFRRVGNVVVTSTLVTGRSASLRFVNLKDLMSQEMWEAYELLESFPKRVTWVWEDRQGWKDARKDSIVLSDSRSGAIAVLPNYVRDYRSAVYDSYDLVLNLLLSVASGLLSKNVPEDFEGFVGAALGVLKSEDLETIARYVLRRNVRLGDENLREKLVNQLTRVPYGVRGYVGDSRRRTDVRVFPFEIYVRTLRVVRRYL